MALCFSHPVQNSMHHSWSRPGEQYSPLPKLCYLAQQLETYQAASCSLVGFLLPLLSHVLQLFISKCLTILHHCTGTARYHHLHQKCCMDGSWHVTICKHPLISQAESSAVGCLCSNSSYFLFHLKGTKEVKTGKFDQIFRRQWSLTKMMQSQVTWVWQERNYNLTVDEVSDDYLLD